MRKKILILLSMFLVPLLLHAQEHKLCGTPHLSDLDFENNPEAKALHDAVEANIPAILEQIKAREKTSATDTRTIYVIPTVVHIVYGSPADSMEMSIPRVENMFRGLFYDFRHVPGTPGFGAGPDTRVEFSLVQKDPQGNDHSGVNYIYDPVLADLSKESEDEDLKAPTQWDPSKYFNLWLTKTISSGIGPLAGYAQFPTVGAANTDGVVVIQQDFKMPLPTSLYSRTTSHEIGHWLSLYHPFQDGCAASCSGGGDRVCDSPPEYLLVDPNTVDFKSATVRNNSCKNDNPDLPDNPRNIMNYTLSDNLVCNLFTRGQNARIVNTLENSSLSRRFYLWQEENIDATGAGKWREPEAYFWVDRRRTCVGEPVTFLDYSRSQPTEFEWTFPGGTPETSTAYNPSVTYSSPGSYGAKLVVRNLSGIVDSITIDNLVTVVDSVYSLPLNESFRGTFPPSNWHVENPDSCPAIENTVTWQRFNAFGAFAEAGDSCVQIKMFNYSDFGQYDGLLSPMFDLSSYEKCTLKFSYAYTYLRYGAVADAKHYLTDYADTLEIQVSSDCGQTWDNVWRKGGAELATALVIETASEGDGQYRGENPDEWANVRIPISNYVGNEKVMVKFQTKNAYGNNLYLDEVNIYGTQISSILEEKTITEINFAPNPFNESTNLTLDLAKPGELDVEVFDLQGKKVWGKNISKLNVGTHAVNIDLTNLPTGIYVAKASSNGFTMHHKLVKN